MKIIGSRRLIGVGLGLSLAVACGVKPDSHNPAPETGQPEASASALQKQLASMKPAAAQAPSDAQKRLAAAVEQYFKNSPTQRHYLHLDKPLYQPGETIWWRVFELQSATLMHSPDGTGVSVELVSPKGATVLQKRVQISASLATNDFVIPPDVQGGEYVLRVRSDRGAVSERSVIVSQYQPPRIKKKAEFLRKAYGEGDTVAAAVSLSRATGEAFAGKTITALVVVDDAEVARVPFKTDAEGNAVVKFDLPKSIARGDGLLTLLVDDGGITESLQKRIPIVMKELALELYPEGGQLVSGLPGRIYFSAKNILGKAADISGRVVDDRGVEIARISSYHNGMGRFDITPDKARRYFVEISKPAGIEHKTPLPAVADKGCAIQAVDDYDSSRSDVRVGVFCSEARTVITTAMLREHKLGESLIDVAGAKPTVVSFPIPPGSQGAVRVTLFDDQLAPVAERLVYRGRGTDLTVKVSADRKTYAPRDKVTLTVETKDLAGKAVEADLSMAVVDDTVLSFADDKTANLITRMYLESEMPGQIIEEPNFYFSADPKAARGLDLVLGTQGWRRFEWAQVLAPPMVIETTATGADMPMPDMARAEAEPPAPPPVVAPAKAAEKPVLQQPVAARIAPLGKAEANKDQKKAKRDEGRNFRVDLLEADGDGAAAGGMAMDDEWAENMAGERQAWAWAPVRVFPAPTYDGRYDGPRVDFRETIHWAPSVKTDKSGKAQVSFYLSDSVTSFRATAEGISRGGLPGRAETLVQSKLPVSLDVTMPLEVSAGDTVRLPVTLQNETEREYEVRVSTVFGAAFKVRGGIPETVKLGPGKRESFFATLEVVGNGADAEAGLMTVAMETSNLKDEMSRTIRVVPLGFPQQESAAGTLAKKAHHALDLAGALPGTIEASVTLYPSPLATMVKGTEAMIREPSGCFEQASSANYPNIMILGYLEENDSADMALIERTSGMLDRGYKKLTGYESPEKGFEWFGGDPGHEALTAYGLMEFADMTPVYGEVDRTMINRTAAWLKSRRDGKGGYKRNARALDSFGAASEEVTNGYITYALSEAGEKDLAAELELQRAQATTTKDPYVMALAVNALANAEPTAATTTTALNRLAGMQGDDGAWKGANHSITRSGGAALDIETTALASMALLQGGDTHSARVRKAVEWLNGNRSGFGSFSSTQATILSLKAMTEYARASRKTTASGTVQLWVNGKQAGQVAFEQGHTEPLVFDDLASVLRPGKNDIELRLDSDTTLPYSIAVTYRSRQPASSPETKVALRTSIARAKVPMGEGVKMKVSVENITAEGIPMTLARVGIPGGLAFQTWQLKELKDKKLIDFYETREREVVLYFRSMGPKAKKELDIDLIARVPGAYTAPASSAYLYYTDEYKAWVPPVTVTVEK
jgi:uncharacterized protein YfaS (alpha-2-macroglobulin family)